MLDTLWEATMGQTRIMLRRSYSAEVRKDMCLQSYISKGRRWSVTCGRSMGYGAGTTSSEGSEEGLRAKVVLSHLAVLDQAFVFTFRALSKAS